MKYAAAALCLMLWSTPIYCQNSLYCLTAGPMIGSVKATSAKVWLSYTGNLGVVTLIDTQSHESYTCSKEVQKIYHGADTALILSFAGLKPGHIYQVKFDISTLKHTPDCRFTTQIDTPVKDLDFMVGSCALLTTGFWRAFFPGADVGIYRQMAHTPSDFMVWLGDNIYYLGSDYKSYDNMYKRNMDIRQKFKVMSNLLTAQPNYSIWDDHDYGWNDADKNFPLKDTALNIFRGFWPNTYEDTERQTYFTFRYYDAEFFMTDGRWYRDAPGDTAGAFLGAEQLSWLENKLQKSDATFKFICIGSQVLNDNHHGESYAQYPKERNQLLDYIADHNIRGVVFMTGDKHYSELARRVWKGYPIYDFTSSPISSPVIPRKHIKTYQNLHSVKGTVVYQKNYGRVKITGDAGNRFCTLRIYSKTGKLKWEYGIKADELSKK